MTTADLIDVLAMEGRKLLDLTTGRDTVEVPDRMVSDAAEMYRVVARLIKDRTPLEVSRGLGAPGNWGYDTPVGAALKRYYNAANRAAESPADPVAAVEARARQIVRDMEALGELAGRLPESDYLALAPRIMPLIEEAEARVRQKFPHLFGGAA